MKARYDGLHETDAFVLFPPAGQAAAYERSRGRVQAFLRERFPGLTFEIASISVGEDVTVIPICGEAATAAKACIQRRLRRTGYARLRMG